jgi:hypothetical protein
VPLIHLFFFSSINSCVHHNGRFITCGPSFTMVTT